VKKFAVDRICQAIGAQLVVERKIVQFEGVAAMLQCTSVSWTMIILQQWLNNRGAGTMPGLYKG